MKCNSRPKTNSKIWNRCMKVSVRDWNCVLMKKKRLLVKSISWQLRSTKPESGMNSCKEKKTLKCFKVILKKMRTVIRIILSNLNTTTNSFIKRCNRMLNSPKSKRRDCSGSFISPTSSYSYQTTEYRRIGRSPNKKFKIYLGKTLRKSNRLLVSL